MNTDSAYTRLAPERFLASELTRGPWHRDHQHAGPPIALACGAIEAEARRHGLTHIGRLTANLLRPVPIGELEIQVHAEYVGRNAAHYSARLVAEGKEVARFTALAQREATVAVPPGTPGHPLPAAPRAPLLCPEVRMPFGTGSRDYTDLIENRLVDGKFFGGPCIAWFRLRHALVAGEAPSAFERVAVAADSGNGISAALDFRRYSFVNSDLTINLLRAPAGEWVCLQARTYLGGNGCGLAESVLFDEHGLIGRATQSLSVRPREA